MTIESGHGFLALLPHLKTFCEDFQTNIGTLAAAADNVQGWSPAAALPVLMRLCDSPEDLIQQKSPSVILTWQGRDVVQWGLTYNYNIKFSYLYSGGIERGFGDDPLFACGLAAEALHLTMRNHRQAPGLNLISADSLSVSELMVGDDTVPILTRILTSDLIFQVEEDF